MFNLKPRQLNFINFFSRSPNICYIYLESYSFFGFFFQKDYLQDCALSLCMILLTFLVFLFLFFIFVGQFTRLVIFWTFYFNLLLNHLFGIDCIYLTLVEYRTVDYLLDPFYFCNSLKIELVYKKCTWISLKMIWKGSNLTSLISAF
jgi:hypothetical protein